MNKPPLPSRSLEAARRLRTASTDAEQRLWHHLRSGRLDGLKFRRQHPIPPYVADFYCDALKLVIELDGSQHTPHTDSTRQRALESRGLKILRFWSHDALARTDEGLEAILTYSRSRTLTPTPLPVGEGLNSETPA
jgi:very-short-patch-repair endonuclease